MGNQKNKQKTVGRARIFIVVALVAACIVIIGAANGWFAGNAGSMPQVGALKQHIFSGPVQERIKAELSFSYDRDVFVVFLSLCDGVERARVVNGVGGTLEEAWAVAAKKAGQIVSDLKMDVRWTKADIVCTAEETPVSGLGWMMKDEGKGISYFLRKGVALDSDFDIAFLEAEMNGNRLYHYLTADELENGIIQTAPRLNLENINPYLNAYYPKAVPVNAIPDVVTMFTTIGFFCDENGIVYDLYGGTGADAGRRMIDEVDADHAYEVMMNASGSLYGMIKPDGEYIYGYHADTGEEIEGYNILRHAGSIWSLINLYRITQDESLVESIDAAIDYLLDNYIVYRVDDVAYVAELKSGEIKLGGNGLTVIMLSEYMDVFETDKYLEIIRHLANGILEMQDEETGRYYHVLNYPDFTVKEAFRIIYYDGEATFALTRAYTFTKHIKYLDGAARSVENFIDLDYTRYRDHWVAYSMNEITKYIPEPRYYAFALRNASENLETIARAPRIHPTYMELLMSVWQTYERLQQSDIDTYFAEDFDMQRFAETIYLRAFHMLNAYFYPEYAMYMKYPGLIEGSIFIRDDRFRVRIDDIQHFIGGYYFYYLYYDDIRAQLSDDFIYSVNQDDRSATLDESDEGIEE